MESVIQVWMTARASGKSADVGSENLSRGREVSPIGLFN